MSEALDLGYVEFGVGWGVAEENHQISRKLFLFYWVSVQGVCTELGNVDLSLQHLVVIRWENFGVGNSSWKKWPIILCNPVPSSATAINYKHWL